MRAARPNRLLKSRPGTVGRLKGMREAGVTGLRQIETAADRNWQIAGLKEPDYFDLLTKSAQAKPSCAVPERN
jgi:hypothetical protein